MDRDELEERIRGRRPGDGFRRGSVADEPDAGRRPGYVPFSPEPEDQLAVREAGEQPTRHVDRLGEEAPVTRAPEPEPDRYRPPVPPVAPEPEPGPEAEPEPAYAAPRYAEPQYEERYPDYDDEPYGAPEDAYAYPYAEERRGGSSALPIIGFAALCVLALAVGAILAGIFTGDDDNVGVATPTPTVQATEQATPVPSDAATPAPSGSAAPATPEPTEGPVAFPDGALYELHVCATEGYTPDLDGCQEDGTTNSGDAWILVVFDNGVGDDQLQLVLRSGGSSLVDDTRELGEIVNCSPTCAHGLIYGLVLRDLDPGEYEVVMRRNGSFADRIGFTVSG
jgi:hypothetical protein